MKQEKAFNLKLSLLKRSSNHAKYFFVKAMQQAFNFLNSIEFLFNFSLVDCTFQQMLSKFSIKLYCPYKGNKAFNVSQMIRISKLWCMKAYLAKVPIPKMSQTFSWALKQLGSQLVYKSLFNCYKFCTG